MNNIDILKIRKDLNMSQQAFAELLGVDRRTIINYEQGRSIPESKKKMLQMIVNNEIQISESAEITLETQKENEKKLLLLIEELQKENEILNNNLKAMNERFTEKTIVADFYKKENERLTKELEQYK